MRFNHMREQKNCRFPHSLFNQQKNLLIIKIIIRFYCVACRFFLCSLLNFCCLYKRVFLSSQLHLRIRILTTKKKIDDDDDDDEQCMCVFVCVYTQTAPPFSTEHNNKAIRCGEIFTEKIFFFFQKEMKKTCNSSFVKYIFLKHLCASSYTFAHIIIIIAVIIFTRSWTYVCVCAINALLIILSLSVCVFFPFFVCYNYSHRRSHAYMCDKKCIMAHFCVFIMQEREEKFILSPVIMLAMQFFFCRVHFNALFFCFNPHVQLCIDFFLLLLLTHYFSYIYKCTCEKKLQFNFQTMHSRCHGIHQSFIFIVWHMSRNEVLYVWQQQ